MVLDFFFSGRFLGSTMVLLFIALPNQCLHLLPVLPFVWRNTWESLDLVIVGYYWAKLSGYRHVLCLGY